MRKVLFFFIILFTFNLNSFAGYEVNENCRNARMLLMDLKIDEAKQLLKYELSVNPENYYAYYLDLTCDAYLILINASDDEYETFIDNYEKKREFMDDKYVNSPYYLACKAEMEMQAGMFNIIHGEEFSGVNKMYKAYKEVYKNLEKHPGFKPSLMLDGFFNVAMANLPPFVKWVTSFFGVSSDFDYGINLLNSLYQSQKNIKGTNAETALFIIFAAKINKTPEKAYKFTHSLDSNIANLFIFQYFKANIEYRMGKNEEALTTLKQIDIDNHPDGEIIYNYFMGKILLRKLDENAERYLNKYLSQLKKQEYFKEVTYGLAQINLMRGDIDKYYDLCEIVKSKGADINERDREALYDASLDYTPDVNLVKAKLLLDGEYLVRFKKALTAYEQQPKLQLPYQLEHDLLKGRYELATDNNTAAIVSFQKVIGSGKKEKYYFASEAALRLGNIYENSNNPKKAKKYYKLSIDLYKSNFYEYIGDKAEKALKRVKAKTS